MEIVWLGQQECHDVTRVGGKAANLSRLADRYPVPPGFCLAASAFGCNADHYGFTISDEIRNKVTEAYGKLAVRCGITDPHIAVRSSAIDEDGHTASFAGQYETFLNVSGIESVLNAIEKCRESGGSKQVQAYRQRHEQSSSCSDGLAVLVQQLKAADASAVVFSINPITKDKTEIVINANWGLGESIVGGTVTPDTFIIRKSDLKITEQIIAQKAQMSIRMPEGGTKEVAVPRLLMGRPALSDVQVMETARLAVKLETEMGWPVDIECAWESETLYLLQCRPITA